jgi:nitroreductase
VYHSANRQRIEQKRYYPCDFVHMGCCLGLSQYPLARSKPLAAYLRERSDIKQISTVEELEMELFEAIRARRSVRQFRSKSVSRKQLTAVLEAVRWAPSWANTQCWQVVVVGEPERKARLQQILGRNPAHNAMVEADLVLVLCARQGRAGFKRGVATTAFGDWLMYDVGLASQNLCLAAHALGLGTVIAGNFDHAAVGAELGLPKGFIALTMIPLGHPAGDAKAPPRRELSEQVHIEEFGQPWAS